VAKNLDRAELVLGVVSPVGSDLGHLEAVLSAHFKRFGYAVSTIRVSHFLRQLDPTSLGVRLRFKPEYHRIRTHMDAGNRAREMSERGDILALHAASEINSRRVDEQPLPETVHIVLSLKHPQEVTALRRIYGAGFFLIGLYTPRAERQRNLEKLDMSARQASELMKRDENEESELGQQTSGTFYQADVFLTQPKPKQASRSELENVLRGSRLQDLTEFGRAVHAEMEALLSCARSGVSPRGGVLYCTTFPCHNCAKHIVAAGIQRVFYVEPYPKSLAAELHKDAIAVDQETEGRVCFLPFTGIAARRYFDLFSLQVSSGRRVRRKDATGVQKASWERRTAVPRVPMTADSYIEREVVANLSIRDTIQKRKANETRKK
jgi:deoxycytidylate deaminase